LSCSVLLAGTRPPTLSPLDCASGPCSGPSFCRELLRVVVDMASQVGCAANPATTWALLRGPTGGLGWYRWPRCVSPLQACSERRCVSVQVQHARAPRGRNDRSTAQRRPIQQCAERSKYSCAFQLHTVRLYQLGTTIPSSRLYRVYTPPEPPRPALPEYENFWTRYFFELNCPKYG